MKRVPVVVAVKEGEEEMSLDALLDRFSEKTVEKMDRKMDEKLKAIEERFNTRISQEIKALEERFEERVKRVEQRVGSSQRSQSTPSRGSHLPGYIEVKGWCTFEERVEKGISRGEGERLLKEWRDALPADVSNNIRK
eukprot:7529298-Karenia_brevis.AAC.1